MVERPKARRMLMESTEMGMEAETVRPARRPTYTVIAPNNKPNSAPRITARSVNSLTDSSEPMYGRNYPGGAVELQGRLFTCVSLAARASQIGKVRGDYAAERRDGEEGGNGTAALA